MNILHIRSQYVNDGGVETFINALLTNIDKKNFDNYIVVLTTKDIKRGFFYEGLPHWNDGKFLSIEWDKRRFLIPTIKSILRIIEEKKIDLIHTHDSRANILAFTIKKFLGYKVSWTASAHGWVKQTFKGRVVSDIDKILITFADKVHFASKSLFSQARKLPNGRLVSIPYFLDPKNYKETHNTSEPRELWKIPEGFTVLGMVGRLSTEKGHLYLLKAMSMVVKEFPAVKLVVVGEGPLKGQLEELASRLGLDNHVIFTGFYKDSIEAYSVFDIFVHSSLSETLSVVILEALRLGKPIVATTVGANRDLVVQGENGYLVPPENEHALAEAIIRLLRDRNKLKEFSLASRERANREFSVPELTRQYEELYEKTMKEHENRS